MPDTFRMFIKANEAVSLRACVAAAEAVEIAVPDDLDYAHVVDSVLQITPDIEEEIAEVERGETVSMSEFKTMFAKWLD